MTDSQEHIPAFPPGFGQDNGKFFSHYDKIQDELDKEMVERVKDSLDGLLVFAGLFAGVNSAFLGITLALMQPDPLDDISSLLQQLIQGFKSVNQLPSIIFTASFQALIINGLFVLSLSSALFTSFFAVLGKQWLMSYRNSSGGGVDQQRWEQLRRSMGAERWKFVSVLEAVLPGFIQIALAIFTIGFVLFLRTMSESLSNFALFPFLISIFLLLLTVAFSLLDYSCPFQVPLSEVVLKIPRLAGATARVIRRVKLRLFHIRERLSNQETNKGEDGEGVKIGRDSRDDEEKGNAAISVWVRSDQASHHDVSQDAQVAQDAGQRRSAKDLWRLLGRAIMSKGNRPTTSPEAGFWGHIRGLRWGREEERLLEMESIMRVIRISEDLTALYHAALNLRSVTDLKLLAVVGADDRTTLGLRECYLDALEDLDKKLPSAKAPNHLLREALGFGTALFHVALSAKSFDHFIEIIGVKSDSLPRSDSEMTVQTAQRAGDTCRHAEAFVRRFMNLQLRRLGAQPMVLTTTILAANALWYAINGIPHSQDIVYGDKFRDALASSEVSWAGLRLLASVSNNTCQFQDVKKRKPYAMKELDWCREAFTHVRDAYHLSEPTPDLAGVIRASLTSGKNVETNALLFKFSWKLFTRDDDDEHGPLVKLAEDVLSAGESLICAIDRLIRALPKVSQTGHPKDEANDDSNNDTKNDSQDDEKSDKRYQEYANARAMCIEAMIEHMGPREGQTKVLRRVEWRHKLVLTTATAYMKYIMNLQGRTNKKEDAHAKDLMKQIRDAQIQSLPNLLRMSKGYGDAKREFEETFSEFSLDDSAGSGWWGDSAPSTFEYDPYDMNA